MSGKNYPPWHPFPARLCRRRSGSFPGTPRRAENCHLSRIDYDVAEMCCRPVLGSMGRARQAQFQRDRDDIKGSVLMIQGYETAGIAGNLSATSATARWEVDATGSARAAGRSDVCPWVHDLAHRPACGGHHVSALRAVWHLARFVGLAYAGLSNEFVAVADVSSVPPQQYGVRG